MTKPKRYKRYSAEFKREALRRAAEEGMTDKAVCDELGTQTVLEFLKSMTKNPRVLSNDPVTADQLGLLIYRGCIME